MEKCELMEVDSGCCHIMDLKSRTDVVDNYELLHSYYVACLHKDSWRRKLAECVCNDCKVSQKVHACLSCVHFSCIDHILDHAKAEDHPLAMDTDLGQVFCAVCYNVIHDPELECMSEKQKAIAFRIRGSIANSDWIPSPVELELLKDHDIVYNSGSDDSPVRGFINHNNSCFLLTLVQSLIHAPIFRDYLLSLKHDCKYKETKDETACFICEMAKIVQECFSGETKSFEFKDLITLYLVRIKKCKKLECEDVLLCWMDILNSFHQDEVSLPESESSSALASCECIIHNTFGFRSEKQHTCQNCMEPTLVNESSWIIQLYSYAARDSYNKSFVTLEDTIKGELEEEVITDYRCSNCKQTAECISRKIPLHLPTILSFNLNHFQPGEKDIINYPEFLDMSHWKLKSDDVKTVDESTNILKYKYYLFAVIKLITMRQFLRESEVGHYICYFKQSSQQWIKCNDEKTEKVTLHDVLNEEGVPGKKKKRKTLYIKAKMLFYHKMYH